MQTIFNQEWGKGGKACMAPAFFQPFSSQDPGPGRLSASCLSAVDLGLGRLHQPPAEAPPPHRLPQGLRSGGLKPW